MGANRPSSGAISTGALYGLCDCALCRVDGMQAEAWIGSSRQSGDPIQSHLVRQECA